LEAETDPERSEGARPKEKNKIINLKML